MRGSGQTLALWSALATFLALFGRLHFAAGCQFFPIGEYLKFVRVPENLPRGTEILSLEAHPRSHISIMPVDKDEDARFFAYKETNKTHVSLMLAQSLEDLVDTEVPRNLLKFRVVCDYSDGGDSLEIGDYNKIGSSRLR